MRQSSTSITSWLRARKNPIFGPGPRGSWALLR